MVFSVSVCVDDVIFMDGFGAESTKERSFVASRTFFRIVEATMRTIIRVGIIRVTTNRVKVTSFHRRTTAGF